MKVPFFVVELITNYIIPFISSKYISQRFGNVIFYFKRYVSSEIFILTRDRSQLEIIKNKESRKKPNFYFEKNKFSLSEMSIEYNTIRIIYYMHITTLCEIKQLIS